VILAASPENAHWAGSYGCPFRPVGSNVKTFLQESPDPQTFKAFIAYGGFLRQALQLQLAQLPSIIKGADLVLGAALILGARTVAQSLNVPYRFIAFCPQVLPSSQHPSVLIRNHNLPGWLNRLSWWFTDKTDFFHLKVIINKERRRLGLQPVREMWRHLLGDSVIVASDKILAPVPEDVAQDCAQTGYIHLEHKGKLSSDLEAFLASGPPPLYVGFGSMPSEHPEKITRMVLDAGRFTTQRVIMSCGGLTTGHTMTTRDCKIVDDVPHTLLFPRVAVVIHHGGSGTTATAARAGVPQIIVPHVLDQYYWGSRIYRMGLGPRPIPRSRLTTENLCKAIHECILDETMRWRARQVATVVQGQDSLGQAVRVIESGPPSNLESLA
jgi:UDP:flavonoid glycosyltransferase YjiC (YdhE family)